MVSKLLPYNNSLIHYQLFGRGKQLVLCFHGYGEEAASFEFLEKYAGDIYFFCSIDLPFHGKTIWKEANDFTSSDLSIIIQTISEIAVWSSQKIILLGFSLGARVALSLYECEPHHFEKMVLLAPDGIKLNQWYWVATQTRAGNKLFKFTMQHPSWFLPILKGLNKLKLVNTSIFKFVIYYIGEEKVRQELYDRWTCLRLFKPNITKVKSLIRENNTFVRLIYGNHDRIIVSTRGEKFREGIENHCTITILPSGHQVLREKYIAEIVDALLH